MIVKIPPLLDRSLTFYLAGPMSNIENYNYPAFERNTIALEAAGLKIESPHRNAWPEGEVAQEELWRFMMKAAIRQLLDSQGIILMRGWTASSGAITESNIAAALKYPTYFLDGEYLVPMHSTREGD